MAIAAKRFSFLDNETNIASTDFLKESNLEILNSPNNELTTLKKDMEKFLENFKQSDQLSSLTDMLPSNLRSTKDILPNMADMSALPMKDIEGMLSSVLSGNLLALADINKLSSSCKQKAGSKRNSGKPYGKSNNCNGNKRKANSKCDSKAFGDAVNKASGGSFSNDFLDLDSLLNGLTSLSSMGFDMNMCGVFGSLSSKIPDKNVLSKASGMLVGSLASSGNVLGMLDLASSSAGLNTKTVNPSASSMVLSSYKHPSEIRQRDRSMLADRVTGAAEIFDSRYNQSQYDNSLSTQGVKNPYMNDLYQTKALDHVYDESSLDIAPDSDDVFLSLAY